MAIELGKWRPKGLENPQKGTINAKNISSIDELLSFANDHGLKSYPLDVSALAKALGISVSERTFEDNLSGMLQCQKGGHWEIFLNKSQTEERKRFTIAHELAHYVLHRESDDVFEDEIFYRSEESNMQEWQANRFAGELLVPKDEFKRKLEIENVRSVFALAQHFKVSSVAMKVRITQMGYECE